MKLALVGVGQGGGKIMEALMEYDDRAGTNVVRDAIAVNTAKADLVGLSRTPLDHRILIGQSRVKGHGAGADNQLGAEIALEDVGEVMNAVDRIATHDVDAFLVLAALGGGTGSGAAPVIARELGRIYTEPVYGFGVLPSHDEGSIYTLNAARSFLTFVREVDNLVMFDNDAWRETGESLASGYAHINEEIARRLGILFSAGEIQEGQQVAESVVDASEIINTFGSGGISTIGYAVSEIERPERSIFGTRSRDVDPSESMNRVLSTVRRAALGRLTIPAELSSTERALVVVSGPPEYLSRKGIERARTWIEELTGCMEVRGGDYPIEDTSYVGATVLFSGVTDIPRIKELQQVAIETQHTMEELRKEAPEGLDDLLWSGEGDIEPLF
jgi:cell division GTPase FtsZ